MVGVKRTLSRQDLRSLKFENNMKHVQLQETFISTIISIKSEIKTLKVKILVGCYTDVNTSHKLLSATVSGLANSRDLCCLHREHV